MPESRNKGGRIPRVSDEDLLDVFRATSDPVLSTSEVADAVPIQRRGVLSRLRDLEEDGLLESKQIGGRNTVWWLPDEQAVETDTHAPRADATEDPVDAPDATDADESDARDPESAPGEWFPDLSERLPGSGANLEGRIQAARDIHDYLKEEGSGQRSDFKEVVDVKATGYKDFNSFYTNCMDNGGVLAELPGVQPPGEGGHTYRYDP